MKICFYGSANNRIDSKYILRGEILSEKFAKRGHSLVYGSGSTGMMGAAFRGFKKGGGFVHGVVPEFFKTDGYETVCYDCDKTTWTSTMAERKKIMEDECDAFIITPGGIGTLEEFFEALTLKQLNRHNKPIVIYNIFGYYDDLQRLLEKMTTENFMVKDCLKIYKISDNDEEIINYVENYNEKELKIILKK